jgi:hypothetical protein
VHPAPLLSQRCEAGAGGHRIVYHSAVAEVLMQERLYAAILFGRVVP